MRATGTDQGLVWDTLNGLTSFIVPGPDVYSVAQGISSSKPGGVDTGITEILMAICLAQPSSSPESLAAEAVTGLLNRVARRINPMTCGQFASPFACLSFAEKVAVFALIQQHPSMTLFHELSALRFFVQTTLACSEIAGPISEPVNPAEWRQGWIVGRHSGVC